MSSSDEGFDDFDNDSGSESEGYTPVKASKAKATTKAAPKAAAKPKSTAAKAAPKPKAAAAPKKKKPLVEHDDNADDDVDDDMFVDDAPSGSTQAAAPLKNKTASEKYTKLTQIEHILKRPDSYIGSVELVTQTMWTFDPETKRMVYRDVSYVPGFFKIVDEILVNAADNKTNDPNMDTLKVTIDLEENVISIYNNGKGIPIEIHSKEGIYIPELIFGHLLSGSNYDDNEKKLTGGRNGFGAKLANIYSHEFSVETVDRNTQQKYKQTWKENMGQCGKAKITKSAKGEEFTRITFRPDLARFGMDRIDEDTASLLFKRVYDMAGVLKDVKVHLNDERLKIKGFKSYVELFLSSAAQSAAEASGGAAQAKSTTMYERINDRWEIAFAVSPEGSFQHVSFANAISTTKGGTHVDLIANQIGKNLIAQIEKKNKGGATVKLPQVRNHMWIFVNAMIENPTFDSQTKEQLTLTASKFGGGKPVVSEDFMKKVSKSAVMEHILNWAKFKADQQMKKTDGSKRSRLVGMPKLSDANNAGTKHAKDCTLILTEGDSAKALAVAGLAVVGRDNFGVFPLRGKLLNVREAKHEQIMKNEEIQSIKKIVGLSQGKNYADKASLASLRYGRIMIMTDQDHDGSHIKGLIINFLDHFFPSLLTHSEFLVEFVTPIVRVTKGKQIKNFFTIPEYELWLQDNHGWTSKYYKGLGTSKDEDAVDYFSAMEKHMIPFAAIQDGERELIDLAFSKKKADDRKEWLRQLKPGTYLDHRLEEIPYTEFINKELILFSQADNVRSIPSIADGLKPGQRKVIWATFKRNLKKEIKVAQLVGYVSEKAAYHHGEMSLMATIVNLAQDFVGSNNLNLLSPNGQYGTRHGGGSDHASARYIFTELMPLAPTIFNPADAPLFSYLKDDDKRIEPEWYLPILPMVLVNGAEGIGTGWSTNIPCFNPVDIVANLKRLMNDEEIVPMHPWWRGFRGEVTMTAKNKYDVCGLAKKLDDTTVEVTELPIQMWTKKFKEQLENQLASEKDCPIKNYQEHHANHNVHFVIQMTQSEVEKAEKQGLVDYFKLRTKISTSNMICFDFEGKIKKYDSPEDIVQEFYSMRMTYYQKRKDWLAEELKNSFEKLTNQARFVQMIVDKKLSVSGRKKADVIADLRKNEFRPFPKKAQAKAAGEKARTLDDSDADSEDEETGNDNEVGSDSDFDYLLGMAIYNLTKEKIEKLLQQAADKEAEWLALLKVSPKEMWNADLDKFLVEWEVSLQVHAAKSDLKGKRKGKKNQVLRTRKSLGKGGDSDDDDFKPIKAPRKPPAAKKKDGAAASHSGPANPAPKRKAAEKKPKAEDSDFEMDGPPPPPAKKTTAAASKSTVVDSDIEMEDKPPAKPAPRKASKTVSKPIDVDSDSEAEVIPKGKGKGRAAPPKRKSIDTVDSDEDDDYGGPAKKQKKTVKSDDDDFDTLPAPKPKAKGKARKSLGSDDDDDKPKPAAKKKAGQSSVTDFFDKPGPSEESSKKPAAAPTQRKISKSMKPASPPKPKQPPPPVNIDSDDDFDSLPKPPPRAARPARAPPKKYIAISDDDDGGDGSDFEDI